MKQPESKLADTKDPTLLSLTRTLSTEEDIWSPTYGLKGKLDACVEVSISTPKPSLFAKGEREVKRGKMPFEIKTGRARGMEHRAQTMLYTLLLSERYSSSSLSSQQPHLTFVFQRQTSPMACCITPNQTKSSVSPLAGTS